jgi:hypothetical protein
MSASGRSHECSAPDDEATRMGRAATRHCRSGRSRRVRARLLQTLRKTVEVPKLTVWDTYCALAPFIDSQEAAKVAVGTSTRESRSHSTLVAHMRDT